TGAGHRSDRLGRRRGGAPRPLGRRLRRVGGRAGSGAAAGRGRRAGAQHGPGPDPRGEGVPARAVASAALVATPNISRGGLRSARLLAAGTTVRILLTPVIMALVLEGGDDAEPLAALLFAI